jgi:hypothetical protein
MGALKKQVKYQASGQLLPEAWYFCLCHNLILYGYVVFRDQAG